MNLADSGRASVEPREDIVVGLLAQASEETVAVTGDEDEGLPRQALISEEWVETAQVGASQGSAH